MDKINKIFKAHKRLDVLFQTSDGICFYSKDSAKNHARSLGNKKVTKHSREASKQVSTKKTEAKDAIIKLNSKEVQEWVKNQTDVDLLNKTLEEETTRKDIDPRKGVIKAIEAKITELTKQ